MASGTSNGRGWYYTRSRRQNGRVIREYIGCGPVAELIAEADQAGIAKREADRAQLRATEVCFQSLEAPFAALGKQCRAMLSATLQSAGNHQHNRGEWRKQRIQE